MLTVFTGDDWDITITLKKDGAAYDVSTATDISAAIVDSNGLNPSTLIAAASQDSGATGANWASGIVVIEIPNASTGSVATGTAYVEVQVTIGGKKYTWPRQQIEVKEGTIA